MRPLRRRTVTIRRQLIAIVLVPSISLIIVALSVTGYLALQTSRSQRLENAVSSATGPAADTVRALQQERRISLVSLSGGSKAGLTQARQQVDAGLVELLKAIPPLLDSADSPAVRAQFDSLRSLPGQLRQLRAGVDARKVDVQTAYGAYSTALTGFGSSVRTATRQAPDARSTYDQTISLDIFYSEEAYWRSVTLTQLVLAGYQLPDLLAQDFFVQTGGLRTENTIVSGALEGAEKTHFDSVINGTSMTSITTIQSALAGILITRIGAQAGGNAAAGASAAAAAAAAANAATGGGSAAAGTSPSPSASAGSSPSASEGAGAAGAGASPSASARAGASPSASPDAAGSASGAAGAAAGNNPTGGAATGTSSGDNPADGPAGGASAGSSPGGVGGIAGGEAWSLISQKRWNAAVTEVGDGLDKSYDEHVTAAMVRSSARQDDNRRRAWWVGAGLLALGIVVIIIAFRLSGRVARRLLALRDDTRRLTSQDLPEAINALRQGRSLPDDFGARLQSRDDEIGQVAEAFNEAQKMAVDAAAAEATTRTGTRNVFLTIARRSQSIAYQQLKVLDRAQDLQDDPTHLEMLFQVDQLATRARRHAENLVILAGKQPGRRWSKPVPLNDVVHGAIGETQHYRQVRARKLPDVSITAEWVADVIHILAELIDNATTFGLPGSPVEVRGNVVGQGIVLEIEDRGIGMKDEQRAELNDQLAQRVEFSDMAFTAETRLGLFVVAWLAGRHDIRVTLLESRAYGGTIAVVLLPATVLVGQPEFVRQAPLGSSPAAPASAIPAPEFLSVPRNTPPTQFGSRSGPQHL